MSAYLSAAIDALERLNEARELTAYSKFFIVPPPDRHKEDVEEAYSDILALLSEWESVARFGPLIEHHDLWRLALHSFLKTPEKIAEYYSGGASAFGAKFRAEQFVVENMGIFLDDWERLLRKSDLLDEASEIISQAVSEELISNSNNSNSPTEFSDGIHWVGVTISPGTYTNINSSPRSGCYWARLSGFSGEINDLIANSFSDSVQIVEIDAFDAGFETEGCGTWIRVATPWSTRTSAPTPYHTARPTITRTPKPSATPLALDGFEHNFVPRQFDGLNGGRHGFNGLWFRGTGDGITGEIYFDSDQSKTLRIEWEGNGQDEGLILRVMSSLPNYPVLHTSANPKHDDVIIVKLSEFGTDDVGGVRFWLEIDATTTRGWKVTLLRCDVRSYRCGV